LQNDIQQESGTGMDSAQESELPPYVISYQLSDLPFTSSTIPPSYYMDADRKQYLNHLLHLVQSSDLIQVVVGEKGSGKSTLVQKFIEQAGPGLRCCHIKASAGLSEQDLLTALASCLDLPDNLNSSAILELLWEQGLNLQRNDLTPVILIDDAQNLSSKTLDVLLQLQRIGTVDDGNNESPWRIILFTHPSHTLELIELDIPLHFIELTEFNEQQTEDYLNFRLRAAGLKTTSPLSKKDIAFIHKHAEGNLNLMHQLAHQVLTDKQPGPEKPAEAVKITKTERRKIHIKPAAWLSMLAVVVLTVILFFQDKINQLVETGDLDKADTLSQRHALPEQIPDNIPNPVLAEIVPAPATEENTTALETADENVVPASPADKPVANIIVEDVTESDTTEEVVATAVVEDKPAPATVAQPTEKSAPIVSKIPEEKAAPVTMEKPTTKPSTDKPTVSENVSSETPAAISLASTLEAQGIQDKRWIMQQPAASITAQMMASSRVDALLRQAKNPVLEGKTAIYHILRNNKDWFVLVYGSYQDRNSMRKSLDKLPAALRKNKPWVRPFAAVHAEIQAGKK